MPALCPCFPLKFLPVWHLPSQHHEELSSHSLWKPQGLKFGTDPYLVCQLRVFQCFSQSIRSRRIRVQYSSAFSAQITFCSCPIQLNSVRASNPLTLLSSTPSYLLLSTNLYSSKLHSKDLLFQYYLDFCSYLFDFCTPGSRCTSVCKLYSQDHRFMWPPTSTNKSDIGMSFHIVFFNSSSLALCCPKLEG